MQARRIDFRANEKSPAFRRERQGPWRVETISRSLSREELTEIWDGAGFLTHGSLPGISPSPSLVNNEWRAILLMN
jgi:hypothetical protein